MKTNLYFECIKNKWCLKIGGKGEDKLIKAVALQNVGQVFEGITLTKQGNDNMSRYETYAASVVRLWDAN